MSERTYLLGLPVAVSVHSDGRVHLAVDAAELSVSIEDDDEHTDDERAQDAEAVAAAFTGLVERHECWRITAATMQHETADRRKRGWFLDWVRGA